MHALQLVLMASRLNSFKLSPRKPISRSQRKNYTEDEVQSTITSALFTGTGSISDILSDIFTACAADSAEPQRRVAFETCITALHEGGLHSQVVKDVIGKLLFEVDELDGVSLVTLAEMLIKGVKEGHHHALRLFPRLLSVISSKKTICYSKGKGEVGGTVQMGHLLNSLCGCRWDEGCVQHIAHICEEIPMSSEELEFLIEKILRVMKGMKVTELPPLVYQLLVLSVKGHRATVLNGIRTLFNYLDQEALDSQEEEDEDSVVSVKSSRKELLETEGTVILHITWALKEDPELRKVFIKSLKTMQCSLSPGSLSLFNMALVLSLAKIHIFEDVVFSFMKEVILRSFKEQERLEASKWMQDVSRNVPSTETLLLDMVGHSLNGWDHVVEGLFIVGLQLMETCGLKSAPVAHGHQYKASCLGSKLLYQTFKVHVMVRQELVTQLVNRILTNASSYVGHYTELLTSLVEDYHQASLESLPKLKEAFNSLPLLPPQPALELLHSVLPLVQFNVSLRDSLLLVLRKSLFSKSMDGRKIAVSAYLMLLRRFKVLDTMEVDSQNTQTSMSSSQVMVEVHGHVPTGNGALCLEILGILRRALTKQYDVRLSLYDGLCKVFYSNSKLAQPIMSLLLEQFFQYYEKAEATLPPLKLSVCLSLTNSETSLLEPLDALLRAMQLCVFKFSEWQDKMEDEGEGEGGVEIPEVMELAKDTLTSVVDRMGRSELDDFELDRSSDFSMGSSVGQRNRVLAELLMRIYETLMEFTFTVGEFSMESAEQTLKMFQCYKRILDILQEKGGAQGGGAGGRKVGGALGTKSNLTLQVVVKFLQALFSDSNPNHQQALKILRDSSSFPKYVVNIAVQKIRQIHSTGTCDGAFADFRPDKLFKMCCQLARVLFKQVENATTRVSSSKKDKGKSIPVLCLEGLSELVQIVVTRYHSEQSHNLTSHETAAVSATQTFLTAINPSVDNPAVDMGTALEEKIHFFIRQLQRLVSGVLDANMKEWSMKEVIVMVGMIRTLAGQLETDSAEVSAVLEWTTLQCKDQNVGDVSLTKAFVTFLLALNARLKGSVKMLVKLSQDVHYHLGDVDEDTELESTQYYAIVSRNTAPNGVLSVLYSHFELVLMDADWLIACLKTELDTTSSEDILETSGTASHTSRARDCYSSLCSRLAIVVSGLNELVQTSLSAGPNTTGLLKLITKFYTTLLNLTKYCQLIYLQTSYILPKFKTLVCAVGTDLTQQVYSFLTYIQTQQLQPGGADGKTKKGKGKGKGEKKSGDSSKAHILRETRSFPSLIYAIEQFEKFLIQLEKKSKENLMESFKRSLARDFKIDSEVIDTALNDEEGEEEGPEEEEFGDTASEGEGTPPAAKRLRKN